MKIKSTSIELWDEFFNGLTEKGFIFPDFSNAEEIFIFSDYAGERSTDKYYSYSFYILDKSDFIEASKFIAQLRQGEQYWGDTSFIEYKKLKDDNVRRRMLPKFLRTLDQFNGLVITVLIDQNSPDYFLKVNDNEAKLIETIGLGLWKTEILRKSANILSILGFILKQLLNDRATFVWYSDRDAIFGENQGKQEKTLDMLIYFLNIYEIEMKNRKFKFISDNNNVIDSDFMAVADLSAGAVLDYYQTYYPSPQHGKEIKEWAKDIIAWMSLNSTNLKKLIIIGQEREDNKQLISIRNFG